MKKTDIFRGENFEDMKGHQRWTNLVLVVLGVVGILAFLMREPRYKGRTLTSWLEQCSDTPLMEAQKLQEAQDAVRAMPVQQVLPRLLDLVEAKEDPVSPWIMDKSARLGLHFLKWRSAEDRQMLGIAGYEVLGTNAASTVPRLARLLEDKDHDFTALRCLIAIGPAAEAPVCDVLTNGNSRLRYFATQGLAAVIEDEDEFFRRMKECLKDSEEDVRFVAVQTIGIQVQAPDLAIPLLIEAMADRRDNVASMAAKHLKDFGTNALVAFTQLTNAAETGGPGLCRQALNTLVAIAPNESLPIVLDNFRSAELPRRRHAVALLCTYPIKSPEILPAIELAAIDPDPGVARKAKEFVTKRTELPDEFIIPSEPSHEGKRLGEWLKMLRKGADISPEGQAALRQMGTNALPALMARLTYTRPPFGLPAHEINIEALVGLIALGEDARPVLPELRSLMDSTNAQVATRAMMATLGMGADTVPCLIKGLSSPHDDVRNEAVHNLIDGPATQFREERKPAVPLLVQLLNDRHPYVRSGATNALREIDPTAAAKVGIR